MISGFPPFLYFILGAILIPFMRGNIKRLFLLVVPLIAGITLMAIPNGEGWVFDWLGFSLVLNRVDSLSRIFGYIFLIMAFAGFLFSLHLRSDREHIAALLYIGSSLGVVFAGDFLTLFIFWEMMAFSSVFLIWSSATPEAKASGFRYILVHLFGGLCLLVGILLHVKQTGSLGFSEVTSNGMAFLLILIGFILNAAAPPLHAWLPDAYPEASVTGTVFLSAFTTKTAVYVLTRGFAGTEILIWIGMSMALYGIVWAILENNIRRILAYSIINQVGFMITGIGIGTPMALNGAISHAFCHILYKALLLMSAGAVLYRTGKSKCTDLGGLYKTMPWTLGFAIVGAASISAFPLFSGFVSKAMIIIASANEDMAGVWLFLMLASAGVFLHAGIKFPYFVFFAKDSGIRTSDPPMNMLLAMGGLSFLCIFLGIYPYPLYRLLPYPVDFSPYTAGHVLSQLQLLAFSALAFFLLLRQLQRTQTISLDTDWFYRKGAEGLFWVINGPGVRGGQWLGILFFRIIPSRLGWFSKNPLAAMKIGAVSFWITLSRWLDLGSTRDIEKRIDQEKAIYPVDVIKHWPIGSTVLWVILFLLGSLLIYYL